MSKKSKVKTRRKPAKSAKPKLVRTRKMSTLASVIATQRENSPMLPTPRKRPRKVVPEVDAPTPAQLETPTEPDPAPAPAAPAPATASMSAFFGEADADATPAFEEADATPAAPVIAIAGSPLKSLDRLVVGSAVRYAGRIWRVGMVNASRARLDPMTGHEVTVGGKEFISYGGSVNISPSSALPVIDPAVLDGATAARLVSLGRGDNSDTTGDDNMAVSKMPTARNGKNGKAKVAKVAKAPRAKRAKADKTPREMKPCGCGCGEETGAYFVAGHDARFHSALLKIERGKDTKENLLSKKVRDAYDWKKSGDGEIPTTNYKGEPHKGYDK